MGAGESTLQVAGTDTGVEQPRDIKAGLLVDATIVEPLRRHMLCHLSALDLANLACVHSSTRSLVMDAEIKVWLAAAISSEAFPHSHPAVTAHAPSITSLSRALNTDHNLRLRNVQPASFSLGVTRQHSSSCPQPPVQLSSDGRMAAVCTAEALTICDLSGQMQQCWRGLIPQRIDKFSLTVKPCASGSLTCSFQSPPLFQIHSMRWWHGCYKLSLLLLHSATHSGPPSAQAAVVDLTTMQAAYFRPDTQTPPPAIPSDQVQLSPCGQLMLIQGVATQFPSQARLYPQLPLLDEHWNFQVLSLATGKQASFEGRGSFAPLHSPAACPGLPCTILASTPGCKPNGKFSVIDPVSLQVTWGGPKPIGNLFHATLRTCEADGEYPCRPPQLLLWVANSKNGGDLHTYEPSFNARQPWRCGRVVSIKHHAVPGVAPVLSPSGGMLAHLHRASHSNTILLSIYALPSGTRLIKRWANRNGAQAKAMVWSPCSSFLALHCRSACGRDKILLLAVPDGRAWEPFRCVSPLSARNGFGTITWADDCSSLLCQVGDSIHQAKFIW